MQARKPGSGEAGGRKEKKGQQAQSGLMKVKEFRLSVHIEEHDYDTKLSQCISRWQSRPARYSHSRQGGRSRPQTAGATRARSG